MSHVNQQPYCFQDLVITKGKYYGDYDSPRRNTIFQSITKCF